MNSNFRCRVSKMLAYFFYMTIALGIVSLFVIADPQARTNRKPGVRRRCTVPMTQPEENACSFDEHEETDRRMNVLLDEIQQRLAKDLAFYKKTSDEERRELTEVDIKNLNAAQKAWMNYQKQHCDAVAHEYEHGTFQPTAWALCMVQTTKHRIEDLHQAYELE